MPGTRSISTAISDFYPNARALNPSDFASVLKKIMKVKDATAVGDFYDDFRFLEIEPLPFFKKELTSFQNTKDSKGTLKTIKKKLNDD